MKEQIVQVHSIATEKQSYLYYQKQPKSQWLYNVRETVAKTDNTLPYFLYHTTDEQIKEGDWFYRIETNTIHQCTKSYGHGLIESSYHSNSTVGGRPWNKKECRKIVATTNPDLWYKEKKKSDMYIKLEGEQIRTILIPKIPTSFIEYFVKEQGKVESVVLEMKEIYDESQPHNIKVAGYELKLTPSGEVIWHPAENVHEKSLRLISELMIKEPKLVQELVKKAESLNIEGPTIAEYFGHGHPVKEKTYTRAGVVDILSELGWQIVNDKVIIMNQQDILEWFNKHY